MYYGISIKEIKKIEICSLMPLHLSKNIPEYQKNLKFSNYREIEKNISFFSSINKIVEMAISIKIGSNFLVKLQNTTSFFLTAFFEFFWNLRFRKFVVLSPCEEQTT